ncbi:MAG: glutamyl-tRNA reductase [Flavobacteriaceae bacterium]
MQNSKSETLTSFYVVGISYKKADAELRGKFSLSPTKKANLLTQSKSYGLESLIAISTCNRTEIYGFVNNPSDLFKLLCDNTSGTTQELEQVAYILKDAEAMEHMFRVGAGLDSQILGDFEIISQLKSSAMISKQYNLLSPFQERLVNSVIQASKRIKTETELSTGATSVSFASVQYILNTVEDVANKNILLFGTGKIGRNTCENLIKHTKNDHITVINRTRKRAEKLAGKFKVLAKDYSQLQEEIEKADVLIVATGAQNPTIDQQLIHADKKLLILDLSIPKNVDENVKNLPQVTLTHLDELSGITDETLKKRQTFIPVAEHIIKEIMSEFETWIEHRKYAPTIKALKHKLSVFAQNEIKLQRRKLSNFNDDQAELISTNIVQKITNHFAHHLKDETISSDDSLAVIKKIFQLEP